MRATRAMRNGGRAAWVALASAAGAAIAVACGSSGVAVQACREIETARCQAAPACGVDLSQPVHNDGDVTACIRFYEDQCLHGLVTPVVPSNTAVNACVSAIVAAGKAASKGDAGACDVVRAPEGNASCAFLNVVPDAAVAPLPDAGDDGG